MPNSLRRLATLALWLLLVGMLMGCATASQEPSASGPGLRIPSPPASSELKPPGSYWQMVCAYRQNLQERLNLTLPTFGPCEPGTN
ncbi:MAG: hypothetical protein EKK59_04475 [Neisseriaceae bacterium]|nr:MAG: hypothetical protein EKK59_04475 [Neisseriaceae bacterium]